MDIFSVDAQLCRGGGGSRGRDGPQGFAYVRPITPKAWCLQSVSHCHGELVRSRSCTGVNVSEARRAASWLEPGPCVDRADGSGWERVAVGSSGNGSVPRSQFILGGREVPLRWPGQEC